VLRIGVIRGIGEIEIYKKKLVGKCRQALSAIPPLNTAEMEFLNLLLDKGEIDLTILTPDKTLQKHIRRPLLK